MRKIAELYQQSPDYGENSTNNRRIMAGERAKRIRSGDAPLLNTDVQRGYDKLNQEQLRNFGSGYAQMRDKAVKEAEEMAKKRTQQKLTPMQQMIEEYVRNAEPQLTLTQEERNALLGKKNDMYKMHGLNYQDAYQNYLAGLNNVNSFQDSMMGGIGSLENARREMSEVPLAQQREERLMQMLQNEAGGNTGGYNLNQGIPLDALLKKIKNIDAYQKPRGTSSWGER